MQRRTKEGERREGQEEEEGNGVGADMKVWLVEKEGFGPISTVETHLVGMGWEKKNCSFIRLMLCNCKMADHDRLLMRKKKEKAWSQGYQVKPPFFLTP